MAAATSTGPIGIEQINTTFYVWGGGGVGFPTIQAAVDYVRVYNGDLGLVYIVHGHDYSENIATITGGGSAIVILDDRQGANQYWYWNGTQYTPAADVQLAGFVAEGMPLPTTASIAMGFSPTGDFGNGSGNLIVTADPTKGMPSFNLTLDPQDGTGLLTFLRAALNPAGSPRIQMPEALEIYKNTTYPDTYSLWTGQGTDFAGSKGMYVWAKPTENAIDFQGQTIGGAYDQTIRLNYLGGDIFLGANASVGEDGTLTAADVTADSITAGAAVFDTCLVDESPVRTFANTADGPSQGMIWPTIGIPVSAGDHWQNPSIDPASLATWPAAGIAVSTGTAWTFSIDPATIPRLNTANNFTGLNTIAALTVTGAFTATMNNGTAPPVVAPSAGGFALGWNAHAGVGETDFINSHGGGGGAFFWFNVGGGTIIGPTTVPSMALDGANTLTVNGDIVVAGAIHATGPANLAVQASSIWLDYLSPNGGRLITVGSSPGVLAGIQFAGIDSAGQNYLEYARFSVNPSLNVTFTVDGTANAQQLTISSPAAGNAGTIVAMQPNMGAGVNTGFYVGQSNSPVNTAFYGFTYTGNASASNVGLVGIVGGNYATFDPAGDWRFAGTVTSSWQFVSGPSGFVVQNGPVFYWDGGSSFIEGAPNGRLLINAHQVAGVCQVTGTFEVVGTKTFVVPHPFDETKELIHACLEGPENGVYYRGEVVTANGEAQVTLPLYFEALTYPEDRSVLLTQIFEDDSEAVIGSNTFSMLMASRVKDGKFNIRSSEPIAKVWWEVKAVRKINVDRLEVERLRFIPQSTSQEEREDAANQQRTEQAKLRLNDDAHKNDRTVGVGAPKTGEPKPEKVRAGDPAKSSSPRTRRPN